MHGLVSVGSLSFSLVFVLSTFEVRVLVSLFTFVIFGNPLAEIRGYLSNLGKRVPKNEGCQILRQYNYGLRSIHCLFV